MMAVFLERKELQLFLFFEVLSDFAALPAKALGRGRADEGSKKVDTKADAKIRLMTWKLYFIK